MLRHGGGRHELLRRCSPGTSAACSSLCLTCSGLHLRIQLHPGSLRVVQISHMNLPDQVWLGRRVTPAPASPAWEGVADSPRPWAARSPGLLELLSGYVHAITLVYRSQALLQAQIPSTNLRETADCAWCTDGHAPLNAHCKLVPARQRVTVSCIVDCSTATAYRLRSSRWPGERAEGGRSMDSSERYTMETVAEELCGSFSIYWRHEDLHDAGSCCCIESPIKFLRQACALEQ